MRKQLNAIFITFSLLFIIKVSIAQESRSDSLRRNLESIIKDNPGLNQKVETSISNGSLYDFIRGLAITHNLNFSIDSHLTQRVTSYFSNETVINVLVYLAKHYNLQFEITGNIISISPYIEPNLNNIPIPKDPIIKFEPYSQSISFDLQNDSLIKVAKKITELSNRNITILPELYSKTVNGFIKEMPLERAIEKLAIVNSFKINLTNDGVYVFEPLKVNEEIVTKPIPIANPNYTVKLNSKNSGGPQGNGSSTIEVSQDLGVSKVSLNVNNMPIKEVIKNIAEQVGINYFLYSDISGFATASVKNISFDNLLTYLFQSTPYTYSVVNNVYMIGDRKLEGLRGNKLIQLKYRSVDSLLALLPKELITGVDIQEFKELNSFLLSGSQPQIREIEEFVNRLDRTVPMVMIEVILLDVKKTKTVKTGIQAGVSDSARLGGTLIGGGIDFTFGSGDINRFIDQIGLNNVFNVGRVAPNFYLTLKALENNSNIDLRQTPKLSTLNGHPATLSIGSTRYYAVSTQNTVGSITPNTIVTQQFYPIEANLAITLKPFVSGDEHITLNIDVNIEDFIGSTPINQPPPTASSKFNSIIRVKNEEMIILGGIERNEKSEEGSGVPFLARIPVIKWLFSNRTRVNAKTVSVVFIKPTIIY